MALCDKCGDLVAEDEIRIVQTARQTFSSPADYAEWCRSCCGEDRDEAYERANARYKETHGGEL